MAKSGFLIKFGNKKPIRCFAASFDYDEWSYAINNKAKQPIPKNTKKITIETE